MKKLLLIYLISLVGCAKVKDKRPSDKFMFLDQVKIAQGFYTGYCGKVIDRNGPWFVDVNLFADGQWNKVIILADDLLIISDDRGCKE